MKRINKIFLSVIVLCTAVFIGFSIYSCIIYDKTLTSFPLYAVILVYLIELLAVYVIIAIVYLIVRYVKRKCSK